MFTGIVESVGTVTSVEDGGATARLTIVSPGLGNDLVHGESIAVNGVCLTVAHVDDGGWTADMMRITLETSGLGSLTAGARVNLERAMQATGRLGGHIMQGHVDGVATLVARDSQPQWDDLTFAMPQELLRYVVRKGSIALNGVSLTVAELVDDRVTVSLIPTTLTDTTFGEFAVGDVANVEVDVIAKYVERMMGVQP
ncbi:riboflavin synthase [Demequina sp.]|uniref:riboflavin synthase n=1 Tax=Demequina sp. TaxID=2050685 RepID=UPI0025BB2D62|nr:riboflavin synthase [Demequina sp.]